MKSFFSCLMLITFLASQTFGLTINEVEVPEKVLKTFQKKYPKHSEAVWDDLGDMFVVNFYDDEILREASFDVEGNWKETNTNLDEDDLLPNIKKYLIKKYGEEIEYYDIVFTDSPKGSFYFINIEVVEESDDEEEESESQSYSLKFDSEGKAIKE